MHQVKSVRDSILSQGCVFTPDGQKLPLHSHIDQLSGELLQAWIIAARPRHLLEIGMAYGVSSLFIGEIIQETGGAVYDIIDPYQYRVWQGCGVHHMSLAGLAGHYVLHEEPSEICLPRMLHEGNRYDFAFVDGFHTFDHSLVDFFYINRMLEVGGIVVFDDIHFASLQKLLAHIATYPSYEPLPLPDAVQKHHIVRLRRMMNVPMTRLAGFRKVSVDDRSWDWHQDF